MAPTGYMRESFRGLNPQDVDEQFGELLEQVERLEAENDRLQRKLSEKVDHVSRDHLMEMVGDTVGALLRQAQSASSDMIHQAEIEAQRAKDEAQVIADDLRRNAEAEAISVRTQAQRTAEEVMTVAGREAAELRAEAEKASQLARDSAEKRAADILDEANRSTRTIRQNADEYGRTVPENADRDAARILSEARAAAKGIVDAAERERDVVLESSRNQGAQLRSELEVEHQRLRSEVARMRDARDLLTDHLAATRVDLEGVIHGIADARLDSIGEASRTPAPAPRADGPSERIIQLDSVDEPER